MIVSVWQLRSYAALEGSCGARYSVFSTQYGVPGIRWNVVSQLTPDVRLLSSADRDHRSRLCYVELHGLQAQGKIGSDHVRAGADASAAVVQLPIDLD